MRVLILGSLPGHAWNTSDPTRPEDVPLQAAGRALGRALAEQDHRAIVGSASARTIDPYVVQGYAEHCRDNPGIDRHLEVQFPTYAEDPGREPRFADVPPNLHLLRKENYSDPSSPHRWVVSHFTALREADVLLTLGGSVSTRMLGSYAVATRTPVLAIAEYGGSSVEVFHAARHTYRQAVPRLGQVPTAASARAVVDFCRQLVESGAHRMHSYFLSYSWADCAAADCIEVFLSRYRRMLFRDEERVKIGERLPDVLQAAIQESDTFLALWSSSYAASRWCPSELDFASESRDRSGRPGRVVLVDLDGTPPPLLTTALLRVPGGTRELRELGLRKIVEQEPG